MSRYEENIIMSGLLERVKEEDEKRMIENEWPAN
jgi:hypothetical protein